ncbi:DUF1906 domain-containing protein [Virgibacillus necropolis]|uniref:glycoside hydrolase domain-containing protein n=1 Tax=Virgibacillus necropolis TaxID=163877 RepID=UPI00384D9AE8
MNKYTIYLIIGLVVIFAIPIVLNLVIFDEQTGSPDNPPPEEENNNGDNPNTDPDQNPDDMEIYWGVDSASSSDEGLYQCVNENFGHPEVWGRYLGDKEGVSAGLDANEADFLHQNNVRILLIYNHFTDATGYDHGVEEAQEAIAYAEDLGAPDGVAIFGDIEPTYPVDSAFMQGWYDTLSASAYEPGFYGVFDEGSAILTAYNAMDQEARNNTVVWTAFPQNEITTKANAPEYNPHGPEESLLYGWQYAIEAEQCVIDTDLYQNEMLDYLW